jgi:hypothetical protein
MLDAGCSILDTGCLGAGKTLVIGLGLMFLFFYSDLLGFTRNYSELLGMAI